MKTKLLLSIAVVSALSLSAFGADYSKFSNDELVGLSGKVAPKDYPDYQMEVFKRTQEMKVKDAEIFNERLLEQRWNAHEAMSLQERREYHDAVRTETQKRMDKMSVQEAREKGLFGGYYRNGYGRDGYHHPRGYGRDGYHRGGIGYAPCPRGY